MRLAETGDDARALGAGWRARTSSESEVLGDWVVGCWKLDGGGDGRRGAGADALGCGMHAAFLDAQSVHVPVEASKTHLI